MSTPDLTSAAEMDRLFSAVGVDLRTDDGTEATIVEEIIDWASETIASYTLSHYDTAVLATSAWVHRRATILACYYLSMRRGNPPQFVAEYKRILEELELVQNNKLLIPDATVRAADIPTVSSYRVDDRYISTKQRVVRSQSTSPYPGQPFYEPPYYDAGH